MQKSDMENPPETATPVNIKVIRPTGIFSVLNWFTNKNKKPGMPNFMFDKKFKMKLNAEELDALKRNGIDLQMLQNISGNSDGKMRKNIFVLPKDQSELDKNVLLNNSVLSDLMRNKNVLKRQKKYKKSVVSTSSLSIKSKNNGLNSKITYIHNIKSKKSIVNSVSSKASLKVGLKSNTEESQNKNILMKGIPEELLKGNRHKKVFVPIYLGRRKSCKGNKDEKGKSEGRKNRNETESNVIPLLLSKLKTMEGQISDIENATKKINEAVSQKNMIKKPSKVSKGNVIQINKGLASHKMYPKRSFRKLKGNKMDSKGKTNTSSNNSSSKANFPLTSTAGLKPNLATKINKGNLTNIKSILDNPDNFIKHHTFVIPNDLSGKSLFNANPNVGCDVMLKLFESLTESNDSHHETSTDDAQKTKLFTTTDDSDSPKQWEALKLGFRSNMQNSGSTSISESQVKIVSNEVDGWNNKCLQLKKNISCPSSSTAIGYTDSPDGQTAESMSSLAMINNCVQIQDRQTNENTQYYTTKMEEEDQKGESIDLFSLKNVIEMNDRPLETLTESNRLKFAVNGTNNNSYKPNQPFQRDSKSLFKEPKEDEKVFVKVLQENKTSNLYFKNKDDNDDMNFKVENINLNNGVELQVSEGQMEKQVIKLPLGSDSKNFCSICIEPTVDTMSAKLSEVEAKGRNPCLEAIKEPKLSITILVRNSSPDGVACTNDNALSSNVSLKNSFSEIRDTEKPAIKTSTLSVDWEEDSTSLQNTRENCCYQESFTPALCFEHTNTTCNHFTTNSFNQNSNHDSDKILRNTSLKNNTPEFGFEGIAYLNREQRKKLDEQIPNSEINSKSQELKNVPLQLGAETPRHLKNDNIFSRHLSESSTDLQKNASCKTFNETINSFRKSPSESLKYFKLSNRLNITKQLQDQFGYTQMKGSRQLSCVGKPSVTKKEENSITRDTRCRSDVVSCVDLFSERFTKINNSIDRKQNFYVVCDENPLKKSRATETPNLPSSKKRCSRFLTTLKEPISTDDTDQMGKGDQQTKMKQLISEKEISSSGNLFENNDIFIPPNEKIAVVDPNCENSYLIMTSQTETPTIENNALDFLNAPETPKYQDIESSTKNNNAENTKDEPSAPMAPPEPDEIILPNCVLENEAGITIHGTCIIAEADTPGCDADLETKILIEKCTEIFPLLLHNPPKVCLHIYEKALAAKERLVRSQIDVQKEEVGLTEDKSWSVYVVCGLCPETSKNNTNADPKTIDTNQDMCIKQDHLSNSKPGYDCGDVITEKSIKIEGSEPIKPHLQSFPEENNSSVSALNSSEGILNENHENVKYNETNEIFSKTPIELKFSKIDEYNEVGNKPTDTHSQLFTAENNPHVLPNNSVKELFDERIKTGMNVSDENRMFYKPQLDLRDMKSETHNKVIGSEPIKQHLKSFPKESNSSFSPIHSDEVILNEKYQNDVKNYEINEIFSKKRWECNDLKTEGYIKVKVSKPIKTQSQPFTTENDSHVLPNKSLKELPVYDKIIKNNIGNVNDENGIFYKPLLDLRDMKSETAFKVIGGEQIESQPKMFTSKTNSYSNPMHSFDEILGERLQNTVNDKNKSFCNHACLAIPSNESSCSDISDKNPQNSFCCNVISESDFCSEHDIGNGIVRFLSKKSGMYKVENVSHSTTVVQFSDSCHVKQEDKVSTEYVVLKDGGDDDDDRASKKYIKTTNIRDNGLFMRRGRNKDNQPLTNWRPENKNNAINTPPYTMWYNQTYDQLSNLEAGDSCRAENRPPLIYEADFIDFNHQQPKGLAENDKNSQVGTYKHFTRRMLDTIKENDLEGNYSEGKSMSRYILPLSSGTVKPVVNSLHSRDTDVINDDRNSLCDRSVSNFISAFRKI